MVPSVLEGKDNKNNKFLKGKENKNNKFLKGKDNKNNKFLRVKGFKDLLFLLSLAFWGPRWARRKGKTTKITNPSGLRICYFCCLWPSGGPGGQGEGERQQK